MSSLGQKERIEAIIASGERAADKIRKFLEGGDPILLYGGFGLPGAVSLKHFLESLGWGKSFPLMTATEFLYGVLPYYEGTLRAIYYMGSVRERNLAASLASGMRVMGGDLLLVTPYFDDPIVKKMVGEEEMARIEGSTEPLISEVIASSLAGLYHATSSGKRTDMRIDRLREDMSSLRILLAGFLEESCPALREFLDGKSAIDIIHTPYLTAPASILSYKLIENGFDARIIESDVSLAIAESLHNAVLIYTSVEENSIKELLFRLAVAKKTGRQIRLNIDPLSAQVYASFLSLCISQ